MHPSADSSAPLRCILIKSAFPLSSINVTACNDTITACLEPISVQQRSSSPTQAPANFPSTWRVVFALSVQVVTFNISGNLLSDEVVGRKQHENSLEIVALLYQRSIYRHPLDAELIKPANRQEAALVVVKLQIIRGSAGRSIVIHCEPAHRSVACDNREN